MNDHIEIMARGMAGEGWESRGREDLDCQHYRKYWTSSAEAAIKALEANGYAIVPAELTEEMLGAVDDDGEKIFEGGTEHYFRSTAEAHWYAKQVWRGFIAAIAARPKP